MATPKKNQRRTTLEMTNSEKRELVSRLKKAKSLEEDQDIREKFYQEFDLRPPTLMERWQTDADRYDNA